jgi:SulP family sulfate permease
MSAPAPPIAVSRAGLAGELWGGFAAMLVALPSAIAYGIAVFAVAGPAYVGHGVRAGIVGAAAMGLVAPLLGGAPRLISAPCAPAAAVLAALGLQLLAGGGGPAAITPEKMVVLLALVGLLAGLLQLAFGGLGLGRLIKFIPYPVVSGYLSGVGVLIFASQVPKLLGLRAGGSAWAGLVAPTHWQPAALVVGLVTIVGVILAPRLTRKIPATIVGLTAGLLAYGALALAQPPLRALAGNPLIIGPVVEGATAIGAAVAAHWSALTGLRPADFAAMAMPALTLAVLLSVDTLKTCVVLDALTRSRHQSNRELIGQGAGNVVSALLGGMPGAGTMGATLVNSESGGRSRLSGVGEGLFVIGAFLLLNQWIAWVPVAALAGILMVVAVRMVAWHDLALLRQRNTVLDFAVIAAVIVVAVTVNLIAAAGAGVGLAIILFLREQVRTSVIRRKISGARLASRQHRLPEEQVILERRGVETTICELQGSLFFGTTDQLFTELEEDLKHCRYLVLDLRRVRSVDFTAAHLLERFEAMLAERDGFLLFSRLPVRQDLQRYFENVGVMKAKARVRQFESLDDALQWIEDRILAEELPARAAAEVPLDLPEFELFRDFAGGPGLALLADCVAERTVPAGATIFRAGDSADELFLIRRGIVRIVLPLADGSHHNLAAFGRGSFFGEIAFLDAGTRSADALATTPAELYVISRSRFDVAAQASPQSGAWLFAQLARALALRLRRADAEITSLYEA